MRCNRELYPIFRREVPVTLLFPWAETFATHGRLRGNGRGPTPPSST